MIFHHNCTRQFVFADLPSLPLLLKFILFTRKNFLKLNTSKCEIIMFGRSATKPQKRDLKVNISVKDEVKCLGYRSKGNLSSLQECIQKSRRAFFEFGSVFAFQGNLSPLSSSSIYQLCVLPILLHGVENWINLSKGRWLRESSRFHVGTQIHQPVLH